MQKKSSCGFFFLLLRSILDSNVKRIRVSCYDQRIWIKPKIGLDTQINYVNRGTLGFYRIYCEVIEVKPSGAKFLIMNH